MGGVLAVAARELKEKWTVLVAALLAGLVALALPLFSSLGRHDPRDARELAAVIFAAAFACGISCVVGAGMINRELVERRHGFLFSKPLSAGAIWGGKVLACWLLAVVSGLAVLLPAAAVSRGVHLLGSVSPFDDPVATFGVAACAILVLVLFAHAFTLMVRSHAPWLLALDAVLAVGVMITVSLALRSLFIAYALGALMYGATAIAVAVLVAPLAAGFAQVSLGRTDILRGHLVLSVTLWGILGTTALLLAGYGHWVQAVDLKDITKLDSVHCAPKGEWAFVSGRARGRGDYRPWFFLDTASGRAVKIAAAGMWSPEPSFSADGSRAIWLSPTASNADSARDVVTLDLTTPDSRPATTPITITHLGVHILGLSPDGSRVAVHDGTTLSVSDLLSGRVLASVRLPQRLGAIRALWSVPDTLLLATWNPQPVDLDQAEVHLFEFSVSGRKLTETGRIDGVEWRGFWFIVFDPGHGHVVTRIGPKGATSIVLCDVRTGARIATLAACSDFSGCKATVLSDGTIAVGEAMDSGVYLRLFSVGGALERTIQLGAGRVVMLGTQPTPGTLVVTTRARTDDYSRAGRETFIVDVHTGTVSPLGKRHLPLGWYPWWNSVGAPSPGSLATRAFIDPAGHFVLLDPVKNTFRTVLQARWFAN